MALITRHIKTIWVFNKPSRQLSQFEGNLLVRDLNFSVTSRTLPNKDIKATIENAAKDFEN